MNKWLVMPRPLVALITSISRPMRPRVVMVASIMVASCWSIIGLALLLAM